MINASPTIRDVERALRALPAIGDQPPIWELLDMRFEDGMVIVLHGRAIWAPISERELVALLAADHDPISAEYLRAYVSADHRKSARIALQAQKRAWRPNREADRLRSARSCAKRRARKLQALGSHTEAQWHAILRHHGYKCATCGSRDRIEKDHIVPVSAGGSDYALNLQPLCRSCNSAKSGRITARTQIGLFDRISERSTHASTVST